MKKNRIIFIILGILVVLAAALIIQKNYSGREPEDRQFSVSDTASITKLFFANKDNRTVKLTRQPNGFWILNDQYPAMTQVVDGMLATLQDIRVKSPVAKSARNNMVKLLASSSIKTEVYQKAYRIDFWNLKLFPYEKRTKVFYVGEPTMDNIGTCMLMEGSETPYVVYIPSFRGFVAARFSCDPFSWRSRNIFSTKLPDIKSIKVEFGDNPEWSYEIENSNERGLALIPLSTRQPLADFDTVKVVNFLGFFKNINFETFTGEMFTPQQKDSITSPRPSYIITLTDKLGKVQVVKAWRQRLPAGTIDETGRELEYDPDHMYALVENGKELVSIQYYVFDNITRPLPWLLDKSRPKPMFEEIK